MSWNENYFDFGNTPAIHSFSFQNLLPHGVMDRPVSPTNQFRIVSGSGIKFVPPGGRCDVSVSYQPDGAPAAGQLQLRFIDLVTKADYLSAPVQLFGNGVAYVATTHLDGVYSFPPLTVAASASRAAPRSASHSIAVWLQIHGIDPVYFKPMDVASPFQILSNGCAGVLLPGSQCSMTVGFAPSSPGHYQTIFRPSVVNAATGAPVPVQTLTLVGTAVG